MGERVDFHVLGPLRVVIDGVEVAIATRRQRALLVLLLLSVGRVVPTERLIDQLWDGSPPPQGAVTLRSYVSNLRQALGGSDGLGSALVTRGQGYCLDVPRTSVDSERLTAGAELGRRHLREDRPDEALTAFEAAMRPWTGVPLADIADHEAAQSSIIQLTETYLGAAEGRFQALLDLGRHADALPGLEAFVTDHPLREEPRAQLMLALYRAGRAAEALEVHRDYRALLQEELGIDPSSRLDALHQRVLQQDPTLASPSPPATDGRHAAPTSGATPLVVGRAREQSLLRGRLDALVTRGVGGLMLLAGEPGIGKSTLLDLVDREAREHGLAVHTARSPAASGVPAFWLWTQIVDSIAAGLGDEELHRACGGPARPVAQISSAIAERIGHVTPMPGDNPETLRFLLYEAVAHFVRQASAGEPVVLLLDDIHWADPSSLELVSYLTPGLAVQPLLVVAAYRSLPTERSDILEATLATVSREDVVHELNLSGLSPADVADLVAGMSRETSHDADDPARLHAWAEVLHERTGGNPFFVRQLVRLLMEQGSGSDRTGPGGGDEWPTRMPPGVRHVITQRLTALPDPAVHLLQAAAVLGRDFDLRAATFAAGMDVDAALDAFDEAARHGLVESCPDRVLTRSGGRGADKRFVHALVQEVVLDALPSGRAARLHAGAARALAADGTTRPDELARHLWAARDLVGSAAVPALISAAEAAAGVYALEQAETHLRRALELVRTGGEPDPSTELPLLLSLFRVIAIGRGWGDQEVRALVDRAMELGHAGGYGDDTARLWWSLFFFLIDRNDPAYVHLADTLLSAVAEDDAAAAATSEATPSLPAVGHAARAVAYLTGIFSALDAEDREAAQSYLQRARRHVEAAPAADLAAFDEHLYAMLLVIEGYWAALTGNLDDYRSDANAAVAIADADGRPFPRAVARTLAAIAGVYVSDVDYVADLARQALDLDQRFGFGWLASIAEHTLVWADAHREPPSAEAVAELSAHVSDVIAEGHRGNASIMLTLLADVYVLCGRLEDAQAAYGRALADPGPYRGLASDVVVERLRTLEALRAR